MRRPVLVWVSGIGALAALDIWCAVNKVEGDTLSECARKTLRTDTPAGKAVVYIGWGSLTAWLLPHLTKKKNKETS